MPISLCILTKNEEKTLARAINSVKDVVDEIVIVDTGSKDKTKKIAKKFTSKIYDFKWNNNFANARNFSISKATKEWILILDADEIINKKDSLKIKKLIQNKNCLGYRFIQKTHLNAERSKANRQVGDKKIKNNDKKIFYRGICRLFQNKKDIKFTYPIHETVRESIKRLNGKIGKSGVVIYHYPKYDKDKKDYYLKLLKKKIKSYPKSNAKKELEIEEII
ncbi:glycosyltransferase [Candidatus Woesearchaeota archaeon]|nr:glycosyltransferase [Candidatus Woesearchaeota archaeon]